MVPNCTHACGLLSLPLHACLNCSPSTKTCAVLRGPALPRCTVHFGDAHMHCCRIAGVFAPSVVAAFSIHPCLPDLALPPLFLAPELTKLVFIC